MGIKKGRGTGNGRGIIKGIDGRGVGLGREWTDDRSTEIV